MFLLIIGLLPVHAERTYFFQCGDRTLWEPVEETYIEGQQEKELGPIKFQEVLVLDGSRLEMGCEPVDFGEESSACLPR